VVSSARRRILPSHPISVTTTLAQASSARIHMRLTAGDDHLL
jgi:hypothetical protein